MSARWTDDPERPIRWDGRLYQNRTEGVQLGQRVAPALTANPGSSWKTRKTDMPEPRTLAELAGEALAQVVADVGGPLHPDDLNRDIYRETIEATGVDPRAEWQWVTCE